MIQVLCLMALFYKTELFESMSPSPVVRVKSVSYTDIKPLETSGFDYLIDWLSLDDRSVHLIVDD